jgi:hypothetical protein
VSFVTADDVPKFCLFSVSVLVCEFHCDASTFVAQTRERDASIHADPKAGKMLREDAFSGELRNAKAAIRQLRKVENGISLLAGGDHPHPA